MRALHAGTLRATNTRINAIATQIALLTQEIIEDETKLTGSYDFRIEYSDMGIDASAAILRECGIELTRESRTINVLHVRAAATAASAAPAAR